MSPMFSEMAGQNVTNGTFPKTLGPKASTYVGYTVIQVLMQLWCGKRKEAFWYPQPFVHTLCAFSQINAPVSNISKLAFLKCILKTERFKTYCQFGVCFTNYQERRSFPWPLVFHRLDQIYELQWLSEERQIWLPMAGGSCTDWSNLRYTSRIYDFCRYYIFSDCISTLKVPTIQTTKL